MQRNRFLAFFQDSAAMSGRCIRQMLRNPDTLITTIVLPIMMMLMFVYVFGGAIQTNTDEAYVNYVVPGIVLLSIGYCAASTAVTVNSDITNGIVDRFRSMPIAQASFLNGHVVASVARNAISTVLITALALIMGFRASPSPFNGLLLTLVLLLYTLALTYISTVFGLLAKSPEGASAFGFVILFLPYLSSAFVPIESMPGILRAFSAHQPITVVLETVRGLLANQAGVSLLGAALWCGGILLISALVSSALLRKRVAA